MDDEQRLYELSAALLVLVECYEIDTGFGEDKIERVRAYLNQYEQGRRALKEAAEHTILPTILEEAWHGTKS